MKKIIISLFLLISLCGCWNYQELNKYSIVTGIAIDKKDDLYEVSVLIANSPKNNADDKTGESRIVVYSGIGNTIYTAIKDIGLISAKELYLGHFSLLVISEDVAKDGISDVIDVFLRESSSKKNFYVAISKDCKAKDTLKIITPLSSYPSQNISDNLSSTTKLQGIIANINFNDLLSNLERPGIDSAINSVNIIGSVEEGSSKENIEKSEPKTYIKLGNLGLFKDDKLVYWTNHNESLGINIVRNKIEQMHIPIDYNNTKITIDTTRMSTNFEVNIKDNKPNITINSKGESKFVEVIGDVDLNNDKIIKEINESLNEKVKKIIKEGIKASIDNKSDVFGFGLKLYQEYPKYYKKINNWNDSLDNIDFNINVNIILKTRGSSQNSLEDENDKKETK